MLESRIRPQRANENIAEMHQERAYVLTLHAAAAMLQKRQMQTARRIATLQSIMRCYGNQRVQRLVASLGRSPSVGSEGGPLEEDITQHIQSKPDVLLHEVTHTIQRVMSEEPSVAIDAVDASQELAADHAAHSVTPNASMDKEVQPGQRLLDRLSLQWDDETSTDGSASDQNMSNAAPDYPNVDIAFDMPRPQSADLTPEEIAALVPSYIPEAQPDMPPQTSTPNTALAMRQLNGVIVHRDGNDDQPHVSGDLQVQYPWALQATLVYRNLNLRTWTDSFGKLDLLHEPQASLVLSSDPNGWLASQLAVGILNQHLNILKEETEVQILAQMSNILKPQLGASYGGQAQVEQHLWKGISAVFSFGGMWTPPSGGQKGHLDWGGNAGIVLHFDGVELTGNVPSNVP